MNVTFISQVYLKDYIFYSALTFKYIIHSFLWTCGVKPGYLWKRGKSPQIFPLDLKLVAKKKQTKAQWMEKKRYINYYYGDGIFLFVFSSGATVYSDLCQ